MAADGAVKETRALLRTLQRQGWTVERRKGSHIMLVSPDGKHRVASTLGRTDPRAHKNTLARLRRAGAAV